MKICILRSYLGSERNIVISTDDRDTAEWTRAVPDDAWALGTAVTNHHRDLRVLAEYAGLKDDWALPRKFVRPDEEANVDVSRPIQTVPRDALLAHVGELLSRAESLSSLADDSYITGFFAETRRQLSDIRAARVDPAVWRGLMETDPSPALASFEPNSDGLADPVVYDQMGTVTGRLTVHSGPQILTLRRDLRSILRPSRKGRRLLMVDFVSHEPRVALCLGGYEPPQDIYDWFREERMSGYSRDAVKNTIISTLYGMSSASLSERLQCTLIEARAVNEIVRQGFNLPDLERGLGEQMRTYGHILSCFGRRVTPSSSSPGVVVNSYLQSTAFDAAMLGFRTILGRLAASLVEVSALFYIHDALVLEVSERDEDRLRSICSTPIEMKGFPGKYWTKVKEVTE